MILAGIQSGELLRGFRIARITGHMKVAPTDHSSSGA